MSEEINEELQIDKEIVEKFLTEVMKIEQKRASSEHRQKSARRKEIKELLDNFYEYL